VNAPAVAFAEWHARLEDACRGLHAIRGVVALADTASTQDAPETRAAAAGTLVTAWRQTAGRGRFGQWPQVVDHPRAAVGHIAEVKQVVGHGK